MENLDFISKLLDGKIVLGNKEEIIPNLYIIPVYKVKISFFNLSTDLKNNTGDGSSGSINVTPMCLLQIKDDNIRILSIFDDTKPNVLEGILPNIFSNIDVNNILKNVKLEA
jgi:uncharacterized spore protein YtfJ